MSRRRHTPEQIITALREAEVGLANGKTVAMVSRELGISEQTYYRWRQEFGGMKVDQARRFKELEKENARLKRAVANLTVDKLILALDRPFLFVLRERLTGAILFMGVIHDPTG